MYLGMMRQRGELIKGISSVYNFSTLLVATSVQRDNQIITVVTDRIEYPTTCTQTAVYNHAHNHKDHVNGFKFDYLL